MVFTPKKLDFQLSPYTGFTRETWIEAGEYFLEGIFNNIKDKNDPVVMPRKETKVTYPHSEDAIWEKKAEYFEGLTRSFFIAAPVMHENPGLTINGILLKEYYKAHVLKSVSKKDPLSVGWYDDLMELSKEGNPFRAFQQTVETCAMVICLWISKEEIWDTYTKEEKDAIAAFLYDYGVGNTVPQNWRLFNMLDLAFLNKMGYEIDEDVMLEHAQAILSFYVGNGWYRDGHSFDYYSCWAFQVYTAFWNEWYGYEKAPYLAKKFEAYSNELMKTYPDFFDEDGFTTMWGRSNIYRNASTSAFDGNMMMRNFVADPGLTRRICSGSLLQFVSREDFMFQGIPTLGFYGQFTPLVQGYSCAESPFWLGKAFLCLHLPKEHPFWTAKENNGTWETLQDKQVKVTCLNGPALCFSNHKANGENNLRTGKVVKQKNDIHGMWNYSKLTFNSKFPWEATPILEDGTIFQEVDSQQYVLHDRTQDYLERANVTFWNGQKDDILYRRQYFNYNLENECHWIQGMFLADFALPYGIMRVDKTRFHRKPVTLTLGAFGFPDQGTEIIEKQKKYDTCVAKAMILKGHDFTGKEKQLAMTIYDGWDDISYVRSTGTNPDSEKSILVYATTDKKHHNHYESYVLISQVITKESLEDFTEDDLFPIRHIHYTDEKRCGGYGPITIEFVDGTKKTIDYDAIEGNLQI